MCDYQFVVFKCTPNSTYEHLHGNEVEGVNARKTEAHVTDISSESLIKEHKLREMEIEAS